MEQKKFNSRTPPSHVNIAPGLSHVWDLSSSGFQKFKGDLMETSTDDKSQMSLGQNIETTTMIVGTEEKNLVTLASHATVLDAVKMMRDHHIGNVIICEERDGQKFPIGMVTDRDLAVDVLAQCADPATLKVSAVMTHQIVTCPFNAGIFEMIRVMKTNGITRLPLVSDSGSLKGIVNAKNLIQLLLSGLSDLSQISDRQVKNEAAMKH